MKLLRELLFIPLVMVLALAVAMLHVENKYLRQSNKIYREAFIDCAGTTRAGAIMQGRLASAEVERKVLSGEQVTPREFAAYYVDLQHDLATALGDKYQRPSRAEIREALQMQFSGMNILQVLFWVACILLML